MDMHSAFYYFFSATPQVLGALLGLFGVLVIFKTQSAKTNLIGAGNTALDLIKYKVKGDLTKEVHYSGIISTIKGAMYEMDIIGLEEEIQKIEFEDKAFDLIKENYVGQRKIMDKLISSTIRMSIETIVLIIVCLTVLPLGELILKSTAVLIIMFVLVIVVTIHNLLGFVKLLKLSLKSWTLT